MERDASTAWLRRVAVASACLSLLLGLAACGGSREEDKEEALAPAMLQQTLDRLVTAANDGDFETFDDLTAGSFHDGGNTGSWLELNGVTQGATNDEVFELYESAAGTLAQSGGSVTNSEVEDVEFGADNIHRDAAPNLALTDEDAATYTDAVDEVLELDPDADWAAAAWNFRRTDATGSYEPQLIVFFVLDPGHNRYQLARITTVCGLLDAC